jgi:hypothetical protein
MGTGLPQAWKVQYLQRQHKKRALQDQAACHRKLSLQRCVVMTWQAAVRAATWRHQQMQVAAAHHSQQALRAAVNRWQDILLQSREDRRQLALAAAPAALSLAVCKGQRVLGAWRERLVQKSQSRAAVSTLINHTSRLMPPMPQATVMKHLLSTCMVCRCLSALITWLL